MRQPRSHIVTLVAGLTLIGGIGAGACAADDQNRIHRELIEVTEAYVVYKMGDHDRAFKAWLALAEKGNRQGMLNIGNMYQLGQGVPADPAKALGWYLKAAEQGDATGMFEAAVAHETGKGTARDEVKALALYQRAAETGSADAQVWLGERLMRDGEPEAAARWLEKARVQGHAKARAMLADAVPVSAGGNPLSDGTRTRVESLLTELDAAANAQDAKRLVAGIAANAAIAVDLATPGGRERRTVPVSEYEALWQATFARSERYRFARIESTLTSTGSGARVESRIRETFGNKDGASSLDLVETLEVDVSGAKPAITRIELIVDPKVD